MRGQRVSMVCLGVVFMVLCGLALWLSGSHRPGQAGHIHAKKVVVKSPKVPRQSPPGAGVVCDLRLLQQAMSDAHVHASRWSLKRASLDAPMLMEVRLFGDYSDLSRLFRLWHARGCDRALVSARLWVGQYDGSVMAQAQFLLSSESHLVLKGE